MSAKNVHGNGILVTLKLKAAAEAVGKVLITAEHARRSHEPEADVRFRLS